MIYIFIWYIIFVKSCLTLSICNDPFSNTPARSHTIDLGESVLHTRLCDYTEYTFQHHWKILKYPLYSTHNHTLHTQTNTHTHLSTHCQLDPILKTERSLLLRWCLVDRLHFHHHFLRCPPSRRPPMSVTS